MNSSAGYYKVQLDVGGFKHPVVVFAFSDQHALVKAFEGMEDRKAKLFDVDGPYMDAEAMGM